jgi:glycosyltransferase involved in cell wall biosynthesis
MKIGIDVRSLLEKKAGGVSVYTEKIIENLLSIDTHNEYFLFSNRYQKNDLSSQKIFSAANVQLKSFTYPNKALNFSFRYLNWPKIDRMLGGIDLFFEPNIIFMAMSRATKKVITLHDLSFMIFPNLYSPKGRFWHQVVNVRKMISQFDKVIAVSEHTRNDIINILNVPAEKVHRIYPGVDYDFFSNISAEEKSLVKKKYSLPDKYILSLAALEPRKNIEMVVDAFAEFARNSDYHLVLAGASQGSEKRINELILKRGLKDKVHILGYVPNGDKPVLYQFASCFVYPSFYEGFGFPPLEAMSCGTPVIASYSSSLSEICGNAALLIDPHNLEELIEAFRHVLNDRRFSDKMAERGKTQSRLFTWEKSAQETLSLFQSLTE